MTRRSVHDVVCWFLVLLPSVCLARQVYVNNTTGDDRSSGMFPEIRSVADGPVTTIGRALRIARGGDVVVIANTGIPYNESLIVDRPELAGSDPPRVAADDLVYRYHPYRIGEQIGDFPLIIEGQGAVLRGAKRLPPDVWTQVGEGTYRYQPLRKAHYQLVVNGGVASEVPVERSRTSPPELAPLQWCAFRGFVYFRVEPGRYIDQYELEAPLLDVGLGLHNARNVIVRNLNVELFRLDGVAVTGHSRNVRLGNIRSTGNGRSGLSVSGTSQVQLVGLDLAGNRITDRLVLLKGRAIDLPQPMLATPAASSP
ncbi:MAG: right-handed parallel beta-helix repeat-containing protein [Planctomycetes bacterium]|nr:right-handed parallel beta-helix repeat-containing protein [Planctomycetota bacterium]